MSDSLVVNIEGENIVPESLGREEVLDRFYEQAGVERRFRPFRFPYGDKGGDNKELLQDFLKENAFDKVKDTELGYPWWSERGLDKDIDTFNAEIQAEGKGQNQNQNQGQNQNRERNSDRQNNRDKNNNNRFNKREQNQGSEKRQQFNGERKPKNKRSRELDAEVAKNVKKVETIEDIRSDNARITKEIYLEIASLKNINLN